MIQSNEKLTIRKDEIRINSQHNYIEIRAGVGKVKDDNFIRLHEKVNVGRIQDRVAFDKHNPESLTVSAGQVVLSQVPVSDVIIKDSLETELEFTLDGQVATLTGANDGDTVTADYFYTVPAVTTFSDLASKIITVDGVEMTVYDFISSYLDNAAIQDGLMDGMSI